MVDADIIDPPAQKLDAKEEEEEETKPDPPPPGSSWKVYLKNQWISILLNRSKLIYGFYTGLWYIIQFIGCVAVINLYSDKDRLNVCQTIKDNNAGKEADWGELSSEVFDFPLLMLALYHMIEWIRTTVLLTVICIGVSWTLFWYLTTINTLFGIVVYAIVHMVYTSEDGQSCKDVQEYRAVWLLVEIIAFWALFFCCAFPMICTMICGKDRADAKLQAWKEADEDDDD